MQPVPPVVSQSIPAPADYNSEFVCETNNDIHTPPASPDHQTISSPDVEHFVEPQSDHDSPTEPTNQPPVRKSSRPHKQPVWLQDYHTSKPPQTISNLALTVIDPSSAIFCQMSWKTLILLPSKLP